MAAECYQIGYPFFACRDIKYGNISFDCFITINYMSFVWCLSRVHQQGVLISKLNSNEPKMIININ